ncbi:hypothetical protein D030_4478A, partial [Vibrio parahaemolyticus AQ3810]
MVRNQTPKKAERRW